MTTTTPRTGLSWGARLLIAFTLVLVGAAAAAWALARYDRAALLLGVAPAEAEVLRATQPLRVQSGQAAPADGAAAAPSVTDPRLALVEARLARLESATQRVEGSAGRADALLVAFAARRALDRGVALGYLETLLVDRFGGNHPRAVATIVTGSHRPVGLGELITDYERIGPDLRGRGSQEGIWTGFKRELGELVEIRRADRPSIKPEARYQRALARLQSGEVDAALAETMRLPGAVRGGAWIDKARRYVAVQRALDEVESAALLAGDAARP